jgi:DNA-binding NtrC family response regulator
VFGLGPATRVSVAKTDHMPAQRFKPQAIFHQAKESLNVLQIMLRPLRQRPDNLPLLALELLKKQALMLGSALKSLNAAALARMAAGFYSSRPSHFSKLSPLLRSQL